MTSKKSGGRGEEVILSYHDSLLRRDDVNLLSGANWLNDALIGFYFEYLEHDDKTSNGEILLVGPEFTQLLKLADYSDFLSLLDSLNAAGRNYIIFPLNDCESRDAAGGTHWSLLVYSKKEKTCFHLDSFGGTNKSAALPLAEKIAKFLNLDNGGKILEEIDCPQQENGYDCGLFAICFADVVLKRAKDNLEIRGCNFSGVGSIVRTKRQELLDLIEELKNTRKTKQ